MSQSRRDFLKTSAAAGAAGYAMTMAAKSYAQVQGANNRIGIAFLGVGGRCQQHIDEILARQRNQNDVRPIAVCDVWDGDPELGNRQGRGLYPSAQRCGLNRDDAQHVTKDYRRLLELREVDVVCIATPDHWHAKMTIDAAAAGKDIYCEKPMTKTIDEAVAVVDAVRHANRVMTVGVQWMADPLIRTVNEMICRGDIGHIAQAQTSYYRNSLVGQWRYYPIRENMTPQTIDWDMWLGHRFNVFPNQPLSSPRPFDREVWAQWRCYWDFGGGMFTDLFVHRTTRMIATMGVRFPARVVGAGGIFLEYDDREVPDVATIVADYDEGCQLIISGTMINDSGLDQIIRGRTATVNLTSRRNAQNREEYGAHVYPQNLSNRPTQGSRQNQAQWIGGGISEGEGTAALWANFLQCVRDRNRETLSTPELGAAAFTTVAMGVQSYRTGQCLFWDKERRRAVAADTSWARRWEERSRGRGRPSQVIGWQGGTRGSTLEPPTYQRLAGPWVNGRDPAQATGATTTGASGGN
jgi:predicted dehydrogenase